MAVVKGDTERLDYSSFPASKCLLVSLEGFLKFPRQKVSDTSKFTG